MWWWWAGFVVLVLVLLAVDLGVFHRDPHRVGVREALRWSAFWVVLALLFNVLVYFVYEHRGRVAGLPNAEPDGWSAAVAFFTGYVVEKSLSADNIFVMALIFSYFGVPPAYQHRVLFFGVLGALVMRGAMILAGAALVRRFDWVLYVFGAFLIVTAGRMLLSRREPDPKRNLLVRAARRLLPVADDFAGPRFVARAGGRRALTPLALALLAVEGADLVFAVDSVPAVFAVTRDPFIVFTSNVFAILGLRSLFFALAGIMERFYYLKFSLAVLLALVGVKMLLKEVLHAVPGLTYYTLGAIALVLAGGVVASVVRAWRPAPEVPEEPATQVPVERGG